MLSASVPGDESVLNEQKHILYWKRCLKTFLPHYYTSNDCTRMTLGFFIVSALDLLDQLHTSTTAAEREEYVQWIYSNQFPEGGFRGSPATDLREKRNETNRIWDPANVAATCFALLSLAVLGDDLERVKRQECINWLTRMQRTDGSFGETLSENGNIEGGVDTRFIYCASVIRWILGGSAYGRADEITDINVDRLVDRIRNSETYDGGISEAPFHEAHAGFTYCAIGTLSLLERLPKIAQPEDQQTLKEQAVLTGLTNHALTVQWLVSRQTETLDDGDVFDEVSDGAEEVWAESLHSEVQCAGFNGRCNKIADTCYSYWVGGSLSLLGKAHLINRAAARRYLLDKTQHIVGGFGKTPGDPPDIYHSYLGLASLALMGEQGLKPFDAALCISKDVVAHVESLPWRNVRGPATQR